MKTLSELQFEKQILLYKFNALTENHKRLYSNMDIEQPKSESEKQSEKVNSNLFSQVNEIIIQIRKLKRLINN